MRLGLLADYYFGGFRENVSWITRNIFTWSACPCHTGLAFSPV